MSSQQNDSQLHNVCDAFNEIRIEFKNITVLGSRPVYSDTAPGTGNRALA
jgi:hypothetical protein